MDAAFARCFGRRDACNHIAFDGMTDRAIVRQGLVAISVEPDEAAITSLLSEYLRCLEREVQATDGARYVMHAGTEEAVCAGLALGMAVGLGTGNVREGARVKLERVGLYRHFAFGGFGDDHELRPELIRVGAQRGAASLGLPVEAVRVVVIGDTPKDVAAAQAIGAECVAVATGAWGADALRESGATEVYSSLTAAGALDAVLGPR